MANSPINFGTYAANPPRSLLLKAEKWLDFVNKKKVDPTVKRRDVLERGWMLSTLIEMESMLHGRWTHWENTMAINALVDSPHVPFMMIDEPIPQIYFEDSPNPKVMKMLGRCLDAIPQYGGWQGWSGTTYLEFFADWILFAFGHQSQLEMPEDPIGCEGASDRLYQLFCPDAMLVHPRDYFGDLLSETAYGRQNAFFPTPHNLCTLMTSITMAGLEGGDDERALRKKSVLDPCTGTGRLLLHASNFSYYCIGQDIDLLLLKFALCNFYMYAPFVARPIPKLTGNTLFWGNTLIPDSQKPINDGSFWYQMQTMSRHISDNATNEFEDSEFDEDEWWRCAPLLKRRPKSEAASKTKGKNKKSRKKAKPKGFKTP